MGTLLLSCDVGGFTFYIVLWHNYFNYYLAFALLLQVFVFNFSCRILSDAFCKFTFYSHWICNRVQFFSLCTKIFGVNDIKMHRTCDNVWLSKLDFHWDLGCRKNTLLNVDWDESLLAVVGPNLEHLGIDSQFLYGL